jgi:hypothetical protein
MWRMAIDTDLPVIVSVGIHIDARGTTRRLALCQIVPGVTDRRIIRKFGWQVDVSDAVLARKGEGDSQADEIK